MKSAYHFHECIEYASRDYVTAYFKYLHVKLKIILNSYYLTRFNKSLTKYAFNKIPRPQIVTFYAMSNVVNLHVLHQFLQSKFKYIIRTASKVF